MTIKTMLKQLKDALGDARKNISEMQDSIADMKAKREGLERAPLCRADIEKRVDKMIADALDQVKQPFHFGQFAQKDAHLYLGDINKLIRDYPFAAFCAFDAKRVKELMMQNQPTHGVPEDSRKAQIEKLDAELFSLECAEELALREVEQATGGAMPRRLNADPRILVAPPKELAAAS